MPFLVISSTSSRITLELMVQSESLSGRRACFIGGRRLLSKINLLTGPQSHAGSQRHAALGRSAIPLSQGVELSSLNTLHRTTPKGEIVCAGQEVALIKEQPAAPKLDGFTLAPAPPNVTQSAAKEIGLIVQCFGEERGHSSAHQTRPSQLLALLSDMVQQIKSFPGVCVNCDICPSGITITSYRPQFDPCSCPFSRPHPPPNEQSQNQSQDQDQDHPGIEVFSREFWEILRRSNIGVALEIIKMYEIPPESEGRGRGSENRYIPIFKKTSAPTFHVETRSSRALARWRPGGNSFRAFDASNL